MVEGARAPAVQVSVTVERQLGLIAEYAVSGLVLGALVGPAVAIVHRDPALVRFVSRGGVLSRVPSAGEISFAAVDGGSRLCVKLWCASLRRRLLLCAALVGLLVGSLALALGSSVLAAVTATLTVAVALDQLTWRAARGALERRVSAYFGNSRYVKAG